MSAIAASAPVAFLRRDWMRTVDHKDIGLLYVFFGLASFVVGGAEALVIRAQLATPEARLVGPEAFAQLFTLHGATMIFFAAIPLLVGFANFLVPLMIGARDVAFPRLNALGFWLSLAGALVVYSSLLAGSPPAVGWFAYAPLTERVYSTSLGVDLYAVGLLVNGFGTILGALNILVTIALMRCPGMTFGRTPLFVWMVAITSALILGAYPALTAALVMLLADRWMGATLFTADGDPLLWQHLFWFFGHPEVYIVVLPAFGMISEIVPVFSRKPIFGRVFVFWSGVAIAFLSFAVWAHHMFAVGLTEGESWFFSIASMLIAIPTGVKILNWLATMWGGRIVMRAPMLFAVGFIATFVIGGVTGVMLAMVPLDWYVTDSYFVVGHFHYVLFGGVVLAFFAGWYYWFPKITGRMLDEGLGRLHFWTAFVGIALTFLPMHWLGIEGMPRRVWTYPAIGDWPLWNMVETVGAALLGFSALVFVWNSVRSLRDGEPAGADPWDAWTLEWTTSSPPPPDDFAEIPVVRSDRPLLDRKREAGR